MKAPLRLITVSLITVLLASCATTNTTGPNVTPDPAARISRMVTVAELAAFTGTSLRLQSHPQDRGIFESALAALAVLVADANYDPAALQSVLTKLPVKELQDGQGALIIGTALILYDAYARDFVKLDQRTYVLPVINAVRSGMARGLSGPGVP